MPIREIIIFPNSILEKASENVSDSDDSVSKIVQNLADTLYSTTGVGLAACQIGVNKSIVIYDPYRNDNARTYKALINPRIIATEGSAISYNQACKGLPGIKVDVEDFSKIIVEGMSSDGEKILLEADGFESIVLQHEIDHIKGKLIIDYDKNTGRDLYGWYLLICQRSTNACIGSKVNQRAFYLGEEQATSKP